MEERKERFAEIRSAPPTPASGETAPLPAFTSASRNRGTKPLVPAVVVSFVEMRVVVRSEVAQIGIVRPGARKRTAKRTATLQRVSSARCRCAPLAHGPAELLFSDLELLVIHATKLPRTRSTGRSKERC